MKNLLTRALLILFAFVALALPAAAQGTQGIPYSYLSAATNNATLVYAGPSLAKALIVVNTNNTVYYLKLYNKATAPTCGTDTPVQRIPIPAANTGGGFVTVSLEDMRFPLGFGFCLVGGIADNDNTNAATGIAINFSLSWQ